jgi:hypothetical protein
MGEAIERIGFKPANDMIDITTVIRESERRFYARASTALFGAPHVRFSPSL